MFRKMCMNVVFVCCMALLSAVGAVNYPPQAEAQGIDSYTKLLLHTDGSNRGTSFTDSSFGAKAVTNTETYDSYTKLMLHMDGSGGSTTFSDSATGKSVTASGNAQINTSHNKFGEASGYFNAYPDYLSSADSDDWSFGTGDWTIDFWVRFSTFSGESQQHFVSQYDASYPNTYWSIHYSISGALNMHFFDGGVAKGSYRVNVTLDKDTWYHLAFERYGAGAKIFINGVSQTVVEDNAFGTNDVGNANARLTIGDRAGWGYMLRGWLDEFRISKGIARWTSDFTPPSSPYGKVATVASQKKFGTASGEFHGSGDYLSLADSDDWNFGSGDFTIDFWVRFNALPSNTFYFICSQSSGINNFQLYLRDNAGAKSWKFVIDNDPIAEQTTTVSTNTWYHVAFVRSGNNWYIFQDGVQLGTTTINSTAFANMTGSLYNGCWTTGADYFLNGYIDEFRISKGIARWTSNFTPPTAPYETDTTAPTVSSTSPASNATGIGVSSAISTTFSEDMDSSTITTNTFTLSSSSGSSVSGTVSYSNKVATFTPSSNLSYSTTYTATITTGVKDLGGNAMSSNYTWSFTTGSAPDTTAPSGSVAVSGGSSYTNSTAITLNLSATDNVGVTGYYLSDSSTIPSASASGWTSVTSTTSYSGTVSYSLSSGEGSKTIYTWYKDAAGNVSSTANATITYDITVPTVTISSPASSSTYTATSGTISLGGSASDSSSGISSVSWSNNRGGNGTATGTASWTVSSISLSSGDNVITVTAKDGANNSGTDTLQVTYGTGTTVSAPTVSTGSASSVTTSSTTLNGTVNANGASTTAWFQYGSTSGSYGNTSSTQTVTGSSNTTVSIGISGLSSGTKYYYRIAASNSGGTSYGSESSFTTSTATTTPTPMPAPTAAPTATTTPKPTPTVQPTPTRPPTLPPLPTPQPSPSPAQEGVVFGFVNDEDEQALEGVTVTIVGANGRSPSQNSTETDENGYYEFRGLDAGEYALTYEKEGYETQTQDISLEEGELKDVATVILEQVERGKIYGYAVNIKGSPIEFVRLKLKGIKTKVTKSASTDADGFFEFADMEADTYVIIAKKKGYRKNQQKVKLEEGASEEIEIVMKKTSKRIRGLLLEEDIQ